MPLRLDSTPLRKVERLDNGYLRAPAALGRVGIQPYMRGDGTVRYELRPEEEVFHADSLASHCLIPVTNNSNTQHDGHPVGADAKLTAENTVHYQVGVVGQDVTANRADGVVEATVQLMEKGAIADAEGGKVQLSCGYSCSLDETPGVWNGQKYDAIQRNIRVNHVALTKQGRANLSDKGAIVRLRLDSADGVAVTSPSQLSGSEQNTRTEERTVKFHLDSAELDLPETAVPVLTKAIATRDADVSAAKKLATETQARADAAEAQVKDLTSKLAAATDPKLVSAAVASRVALETKARAALGSEIKLDAMDETAIKVAVITKADKEFKADGKSADYISAYFDAVSKTVKADETRADSAETTSFEEVRLDTPEGTDIVAKAAEKSRLELAGLWKTADKK
jgi:hypothetical protein